MSGAPWEQRYERRVAKLEKTIELLIEAILDNEHACPSLHDAAFGIKYRGDADE